MAAIWIVERKVWVNDPGAWPGDAMLSIEQTCSLSCDAADSVSSYNLAFLCFAGEEYRLCDSVPSEHCAPLPHHDPSQQEVSALTARWYQRCRSCIVTGRICRRQCVNRTPGDIADRMCIAVQFPLLFVRYKRGAALFSQACGSPVNFQARSVNHEERRILSTFEKRRETLFEDTHPAYLKNG